MKLKIMTFNIQHGKNHNMPGEVIDLPLMVDVVSSCNPDILCLNEVRKGVSPCQNENYPDEPAFFENALGGNCYFDEALEFGKGCLYGNAVWSKYEFKHTQKYMIPDVPKEERESGVYYETRCILRTDYEIEGKPLTVLSSHFGLASGEQDNAVDTVFSVIETIDNPVILMGDFNITPEDYNISRLSTVFTDVHGYFGMGDYTFPSDKPEMKIDYIFTKDLKILDACTIERIASDHFPIIAEVEI